MHPVLIKGTCGSTERVFGPEEVGLDENGVPLPSSTYTPTGLGEYFWIVTYSGDDNGNAAGESGCTEETFKVVKASPEITTHMFAGDAPIETNGDTVPLNSVVSDTTTIDGEYIPEDGTLGGDVTYTLYHGACPDGDVVYKTENPLPLENGEFPPSAGVTADLAGTYYWVVTYSGDEFNYGATSGCGDEFFEVAAIETEISTTPQFEGENGFQDLTNNEVVPGGSTVRDTAVITTPDGSIPTGSVTYYLYGGSSCSGTPIETLTVQIDDEDGTVPASPPVEGLPAGQYNWVAVYEGDDVHAGSEGDCGDEQFFIGQEGEIGGFITTQVKDANGNNVVDGGDVELGTYGYDTATFYGDIVDENGNAAFEGTLTYYVYKSPATGATCVDPVASFAYELEVGDSIPASSDDMYRYVTAGIYDWRAVFTFETQDGERSISSICGLETVEVLKVTPVVKTAMKFDDGVEDQNFRFTVETDVSDSIIPDYDDTHLDDIPAPSGTVVYTLYKSTNNTCTGEPVYTSEVLPVGNDVWPDSGDFTINEDDYGVYNWVVSFEADEASFVNYDHYESECREETFRKDVQPDLTTFMRWSSNGSGDGDPLDNEHDVDVGDYVRDTAQLTGAADGASGSVTFRLHQGGTSDGAVLFQNTVQVNNGVLASGTDWFRIHLFGNYCWTAEYSGDIEGNSNTFTRSATSDCEDEYFTANELVGEDIEIETIMRDGNGAIIEPGSYVQAPLSVTDQAVFFNLSDEATGEVTYQLFNTVDCGNPAIYTGTVEVKNGIAPMSVPQDIAGNTPANGVIYSWIVTFNGLDNGEPVVLVSPCEAEQFRAYETLEYGLTTACTYDLENNTMSGRVLLNPRTVGDTNPSMDVIIEYFPRNLDLSQANPASRTLNIEAGQPWIINLGSHWWDPAEYQEWRRVDGTVTFDQVGTGGTFRIGCNTTKYSPEISTKMFFRDGDNEVEIPHNAEEPATVPFGTTVFDTTQVTEGTSTVIVSGTLTYTLFHGETCEDAQQVHQSVIKFADDTPIGELPPSNDFTANQAGIYFWVVSYSGDDNNVGFVVNDEDNQNPGALSDCGQEVFEVEKARPQIETVMRTADGGTIDNFQPNVPIDSLVYDTTFFVENPEDGYTLASTDAGGTVEYTLYHASSWLACYLPGLYQPEVVASSGELTVTNGNFPRFPAEGQSFQVENVGWYYWIVEYSGDHNNEGYTSGCGEETFNVIQATPSIETVMYESNEDGDRVGDPIPQDGTVAIDSWVLDATLPTGLSDNATGTVIYSLWKDTQCVEGFPNPFIGENMGIWAVEIQPDGTIPDSPSVQVSDVGTYNWVVVSFGDGNNRPFASGCGEETFHVEKAQPQIVTEMQYENGTEITNGDLNVPMYSDVKDTAGFTETPDQDHTLPSNNITGQVTYSLYFIPADDLESITVECGPIPAGATQIGDSETVTITGPNGERTIPDFPGSLPVDNAGVYFWVVEYGGDANNEAYTSEGCEEWFFVPKMQPEITTEMFYAGENGEPIPNGAGMGDLIDEFVPIDSVVTDTAYFEEGTISEDISGTVTFQLWLGGTCDEATGELSGATQVGTDASAPIEDGVIGEISPNSFPVENAGQYTWIVTYNGDANNESAMSGCGIETFEVPKANPEIETVMYYAGENGELIPNGAGMDGQEDQFVPIDSLVTDTAQFLPGDSAENTKPSENISGTVTFQLWFGGTCDEETGEFTGATQVGTDATASIENGIIGEISPSSFPVENAGQYTWIVTYNGDANNETATSGCGIEIFEVPMANPEIQTAMYYADENGVKIENGSGAGDLSEDFVPIDSVVTDTAIFLPGDSAENTKPSENISGDVRFDLYHFRGEICADGELVEGATPVGGFDATVIDGEIVPNDDAPTGFQVEDAGFYTWIVTYGGDENNVGYPDNPAAQSECGVEWFEVPMANPEIQTAMYHVGDNGLEIENGELNVPIDSIVTDTAIFLPGDSAENTKPSENISGDVRFELYHFRGEICAEDDLVEGARFVGGFDAEIIDGAIVPVDGEQTDWQVEDAGTYTWIVTYGGDLNNIGYPDNPAAQSGCGVEWFEVPMANPVIETEMFYGGENVVEIENGELEVPIDSIVTDTAFFQNGDSELNTKPSENISGEVRFDLYHFRGEICEEGDLVEGVTHVGGFDAEVIDGAIVPVDGEQTDWQVEDAGTYTWIVTYSGDENNVGFEDGNLGAQSGCGVEWFEVPMANPVIETEMFYGGEGPSIQNGSGSGDLSEEFVPIDSMVTDTAFFQDGDSELNTKPSENITGDVRFDLYYFRGEICAEGGLVEGAELVGGFDAEVIDGAIVPVDGEQTDWQVEDAGIYTWIVTYFGDENNVGFEDGNLGAQSGCGIEWFEVPMAAPILETTMFHVGEEGAIIENGDLEVPIDSIVTDTAIFLEGDPLLNTRPSSNISGTVTFVLYYGGVCDSVGDPLLEDPQIIGTFEASVTDGVIVPNDDAPTGFQVENAGTYTWIVTYGGDLNNIGYPDNPGAYSGCGIEWFEVPPAQPEIETTMYIVDEEGSLGEPIANGATDVPIDSLVTDTAIFAIDPENFLTNPSENIDGLVTFELYYGGVCEEEGGELSGEPVLLGSFEATSLGGVIVPIGGSETRFKVENIGLYTWIVTYAGDGEQGNNIGYPENEAARSGCGIEYFEVQPAQPEITTTMHFSDEAGELAGVIENEQIIPIDSIVTDTAIIEGQSDNATGDLAYGLYHGGVCEDGVLNGATLLGLWEFDLENGLIPNVGEGIKIENIGLYTWIVTYSGDENNEAAISGCGLETFMVEPATPEVVTVMMLEGEEDTIIENNDMLERGQRVYDTAIISGQSDNATGTVTYQLFADALCTVPFADPYVVNLANGEIPDSNTMVIPDAGSYYWVVTYSGDDNNDAAVSGCGEEYFHVEMVSPSVTTTMRYENGKLIENDDVVFTDNSVIDTAVLVGATNDASGTATYQLFSDAACTVPVTDPEEVDVTNGVIPNSSPYTVTKPGSYYWVVTYSGDVNNASAESGCGEEFFHVEDPPAPPVTPPVVEELPSTGTGSQGTWFLQSIFGLTAAAFVASALRLKVTNR